jgi:hypothetical protein
MIFESRRLTHPLSRAVLTVSKNDSCLGSKIGNWQLAIGNDLILSAFPSYWPRSKPMKVRVPLVILLTFVFASLAYSQEPAPAASPSPKPAMSKAQSTRVIIATERKLWEAWKNKDLKPFRANLSADSIMVMESGVATKADAIKGMESMPCEVKSYELSDLKVTFLDTNTALLTYKSTQDATCGGQQSPAAAWSSSVYVRRKGKWWAAAHQETTAK